MIDSLSQLRITAAEPGRVDFELDIRKEHTVSFACDLFIHTTHSFSQQNRLNIIHGGTIASMGNFMHFGAQRQRLTFYFA